MKNTHAVSEQDINDILKASGFNGKVLGYDATNNSLLIETTGTVKAAIATSINVKLTCKPLPDHATTSCPPQLPVRVLPPEGSGAAPKQLMAVQVASNDTLHTSQGETTYVLSLTR